MSLLRIVFASAQSHEILLKKICFDKKVLFLDQVYDKVAVIAVTSKSRGCKVGNLRSHKPTGTRGPFLERPSDYPFPLKVFMQATTLFS